MTTQSDREYARRLLADIVRVAGELMEDTDNRADLSAVRNESRLRAAFEEAEEFHARLDGGVAVGDLETFLVQTATSVTDGGLFLLRWRKWRGISARRLPGSRSWRLTLGWFTIGWNELWPTPEP